MPSRNYWADGLPAGQCHGGALALNKSPENVGRNLKFRIELAELAGQHFWTLGGWSTADFWGAWLTLLDFPRLVEAAMSIAGFRGSQVALFRFPIGFETCRSQGCQSTGTLGIFACGRSIADSLDCWPMLLEFSWGRSIADFQAFRLTILGRSARGGSFADFWVAAESF